MNEQNKAKLKAVRELLGQGYEVILRREFDAEHREEIRYTLKPEN